MRGAKRESVRDAAGAKQCAAGLRITRRAIVGCVKSIAIQSGSILVQDSRGLVRYDLLVLINKRTVMHYKAWNFSGKDDSYCSGVNLFGAKTVERAFELTGQISRCEDA